MDLPDYADVTRSAFALLGAVSSTYYRREPTWQRWWGALGVGTIAGAVFGPVVCARMEWADVATDHGAACLLGLLGNALARSLLAAADSEPGQMALAWLKRALGLNGEKK